jgi:hypothetical protein
MTAAESAFTARPRRWKATAFELRGQRVEGITQRAVLEPPGRFAKIKTQPIPTALSRLNLKPMGLLELLIIILVLAAIFGGIAVSPLLFVLLIVVIFVLYTRGGFGYRRGGRL